MSKLHCCVENGCDGLRYSGLHLNCMICEKKIYVACMRLWDDVVRSFLIKFGLLQLTDPAKNAFSYVGDKRVEDEFKKLFSAESPFAVTCFTCWSRKQFDNEKKTNIEQIVTNKFEDLKKQLLADFNKCQPEPKTNVDTKNKKLVDSMCQTEGRRAMKNKKKKIRKQQQQEQNQQQSDGKGSDAGTGADIGANDIKRDASTYTSSKKQQQQHQQRQQQQKQQQQRNRQLNRQEPRNDHAHTHSYPFSRSFQRKNWVTDRRRSHWNDDFNNQRHFMDVLPRASPHFDDCDCRSCFIEFEKSFKDFQRVRRGLRPPAQRWQYRNHY